MKIVTDHERCFAVFAQFSEGLTSFEFQDVLESDGDKASASSRLSQYEREGLAFKTGERRIHEKTGRKGCVYKPTGKTFAERVYRPRAKPQPPAPADLETAAELQQLRDWKASAIARFPELGVQPSMLAARENWAAALRSEGQWQKALLVEGGEFDNTETMRMMLHVLSNAA